jgi:hypothetical protein
VSLVYPAAAAFVLLIVVADLPDSVRAGRNEGVPGTFTTVRKDCRPWWEKGGGCTSFGDFSSYDGTVRLTDVLFEGDPGGVGHKVPAQYVLADPGRVHELDSHEWMFATAIGLGSAGYLGFRGWRLVRAVRRRRAITSAADA